MTSVLPPINGKNGGRNLRPSYADSVQQDRTSKQLSHAQLGRHTAKARRSTFANKRDRAMSEERRHLRQIQHSLTKIEIDVYRSSYKHNLCLEMLREGYHLSFRELFNLVQQQLQKREAAGPESFMWLQTMLQDENQKLDTIRLNLATAETAQRAGNYEEVYQARYELACYFQNTGDKWLVDHFLATCLDTAKLVVSDGGKLEAEAHHHMGVALEENGENLEAADHFEAYYKLSKEHRDKWLTQSDEGMQMTFFADACLNLCHIYTIISRWLENEDAERSLEYLVMALDKAKESGKPHLEGEAKYRLGLAYERNGNVETALVHLKSFYRACQLAADKEGMGRACDAIAKAYAREGRKEESIELLLQFVETAEARGMDAEMCRAYHNLGHIYNSVGKYKEASEYFNRAYNTSRGMGELATIQINRVQSGIAQAHGMMKVYCDHVVQGDHVCLDRIIDWKSVRQNHFYEPLPPSAETDDTSPEESQETEGAESVDEKDTVEIEVIISTTDGTG